MILSPTQYLISTDLKKEAMPDPKKILIVDGDELSVDYYQIILEGMGLETASAGNAAAVFTILEKEGFALVLLDINLPNLYSWKIFRWIKAKRPEAKIIAVTSDWDYTKKDALGDGFSDYIRKPTEIEEIRQTIKKHLG